jgi:hypothetical protein
MPEENLVATTEGWVCSRCHREVPQACAHVCTLPQYSESVLVAA